MKKGWETKALGDVCDFEGGSQPPKSKFVYEEKDGYVRFLQIRDYGSDKNITYIPQAKKNRLCEECNILIGRYGASVGKILTGKAGAYNVALMKTLPDLAVLDRSWFYSYLLSDEFQLRLLNVADRSAQAGFSKDDIYNFPVPVPPLAEQQRIVGILDEAFAGLATAKANAERNFQNARALFESHLHSVFSQRGEGWVERQLGDVFTTTTGTTPPKNNADFYGDFMPLVKPPELCDEVFDTAPDGLSEAGAAVARRLPAKSILVSCIGNLGKIGLNTVPVAFNQQINAILPDENQAIPEFMFFQSLSPVFKLQLESLASGTTVPIVNKSKFNSVSVVLPPLPIQKPVVAELSFLREQTQRLTAIYMRKLAALEELKKALLHQAFSGEL